MHDEITESISFQKGYDKGFADAQEYLSKKFDKILSKNQQKSYEKVLKTEQINKTKNLVFVDFGGINNEY